MATIPAINNMLWHQKFNYFLLCHMQELSKFSKVLRSSGNSSVASRA